jgi:hypothetical protein
MISPYWTVWLFLHKGTSPRILTYFQESSKNLKGYPITAESHWRFTTIYVQDKEFNGKFLRHIKEFKYDLLNVVLQQMNMTFVHVPTTEGFEMKE